MTTDNCISFKLAKFHNLLYVIKANAKESRNISVHGNCNSRNWDCKPRNHI